MNHQTPLLPEANFTPLSAARLEAMIDHALAQPQLPRQAEVIHFQSFKQRLAFGTGMAAMAASIMLAFMFTPQYTPTGSANSTDIANSGDISDLLLMDSFGA